MKKYIYPIIITLLVATTGFSIYKSVETNNEVKNLRTQHALAMKDLDTQKAKSKTETDKLNKDIEEKNKQIEKLEKEIKENKEETPVVENQSNDNVQSNTEQPTTSENNSSATESNLAEINAFAESKAKEEEAKKDEPQYVVATVGGKDFIYQYGLTIDEFYELNPTVSTVISVGETYRIK